MCVNIKCIQYKHKYYLQKDQQIKKNEKRDVLFIDMYIYRGICAFNWLMRKYAIQNK